MLKDKHFFGTVPNTEKQYEQLLANLQSGQVERQQLPNQQVRHYHSEFDEQSLLLQQRFHDDIQAIISRHSQLVQHAASNLNSHVTDVLQESVDNIESLR